MTQFVGFPLLTTLAEIPKRIHEVVAWTVANPVDDYVMHFPLPRNLDDSRHSDSGDFAGLHALAPLGHTDAYIAGSAALHKFLTIIDSAPARNLKWKPGDADLFFLNQEVHNRVSFSPIDVVQCKETCIEELLVDFDLPVCRIAMNFAYDFWISAQCLAAIHTRKQNVPMYLRDKLTFNAVLNEHMDITKCERGIDVARSCHNYLYGRFLDRIKKYQDRGYGVNWIDTDEIIPWVKKRFRYGEWNQDHKENE